MRALSALSDLPIGFWTSAFTLDLLGGRHSRRAATRLVAWGVLAFWLLITVEVSSLLMHRLPRRLWYGIHLSSYVIAVAATVHALYTGTDTSNPAFRWTGLLALGLVGFFTIYRVLAPAESRGRNSTRAANTRRYAAHLQPHGPQPPDML